MITPSRSAVLVVLAVALLSLWPRPVEARPSRRSTRRPPARAVETPPADCAWQVLDRREPREHEDPWETRHPLLREPLDPNRVPGLPPLTAVVRTDARHRPRLELHNSARGTARELGGGRPLSQPRFSPDGRTLACTVWKSREEPWRLCFVDVESGRVREPALDLQVASMRWSPDSRRLAVAGSRTGRSVALLVVVDAESGASSVVDSLGVFADHEFSWSPDARTLAVARPTSLAVGQEVAESQLWLVDIRGQRCPIVRAAGLVVREPRWVDARRLRWVQYSSRERSETVQSRLAVVARRDEQP